MDIHVHNVTQVTYQRRTFGVGSEPFYTLVLRIRTSDAPEVEQEITFYSKEMVEVRPVPDADLCEAPATPGVEA